MSLDLPAPDIVGMWSVFIKKKSIPNKDCWQAKNEISLQNVRNITYF